MKKAKNLLCAVLVLALALSLASCAEKVSMTPADYAEWFNGSLVPAYDSFVKTDSGKAAPSPSISLLIASDKYINCVFDFIKDGTQPETGKVSKTGEAYTYAYGTFTQTFEFAANTKSVKITMTQSDFEGMDTPRTEFIVVLAERSGKFLIQYLAPEFFDYYEVSFTAESGSVLRSDTVTEMPFDMMSEEVPKGFAKEEK